MSASVPSRRALLQATLIAAAGAAVLVVTWKAFPIDLWARALLDAVADMGIYGPLVYALVYVIVGSLGVPRTPLNVGAGIVFSFPLALATVLVSATVTFLLTFSIARHTASQWVRRRLDALPEARKIMQAVEEEGFKLVLLLRMNPFVPAVIKGYGFGTTTLRLAPYLAASVLGFLPIACAHVYLGWAGGRAMMSASEQPDSWRTALLIGGGVLSVALVVFVYVFANRALQKRSTPTAGS